MKKKRGANILNITADEQAKAQEIKRS